jgi:hypothetical protein
VLLLASCFCRVSLRRFPSGGLQAGSVLYSAQFRCCAEVHARDKGHMEGLLVMCVDIFGAVVRWKKGWSREGDEHLFRFCWGGVCIPCWDCRSEEECRTEVVTDCLVQSGWGAVQCRVELNTFASSPHPAQVLWLSCGSCPCLAMGDAVHGYMRFLSPRFGK